MANQNLSTYNLAIKYCMANVRMHYSGEEGTVPAYKDLREVCTQFLRTPKGKSILALAAINQQRAKQGLHRQANQAMYEHDLQSEMERALGLKPED